MLSYGKNIQSANDSLVKIQLSELYEMVSKPDAKLRSQIHQLRTVLLIDKQKYQFHKRMLPYVCGGLFNPAYRRLENFAAIESFIVDIDHLSEKQIQVETLKQKLACDERVGLVFTSPGNNGLKVVFSLAEKCFDKNKYSMFYKLFIHKFSQEYGLEQVVDKVTSDATRACFLSVDDNAFFRPEALKINMNAYIDFESHLQVKEAEQVINQLHKQAAEAQLPEERPQKVLNDDLLLEIKKKLNPNFRTKPSKDYFVPQEVDQIMVDVKQKIEAMGIGLLESHPISYGRKMIFVLEHRKAQLNLFYGKKGYSIVKTPVNGSDPQLADVIYQILCEMFFGHEA